MNFPKTLEDAVSYNPAFNVFCWDVLTPDGLISVSSEQRAIELAKRSWPHFAGPDMTKLRATRET